MPLSEYASPEESPTLPAQVPLSQAVRRMLDEAHIVGSSMQKRVQIPIFSVSMSCLLGGVGLFLATFTARAGDRINFYSQEAAWLLVVASTWLAAASMLPTDKVLPKIIVFAALAILIVFTTNDTYYAIYRLRFPPRLRGCSFIAGYPTSDELCTVREFTGTVRLILDSAIGFVTIAVFLRLLCLREPPRVLRSTIRLVMRFTPLCYSLTDGFERVVSAVLIEFMVNDLKANGVPLAEDFPSVAVRTSVFSLMRIALQIAICVFAVSPWGIRRLQAFLATRGHQLVLASAVSTLISGRPIVDVHAHGIRNFRGIRIDLLRREHLTRPDDLFYLSQNMAIGEVDAFISHSWRDDADERWDELQLWRAHFRETHGGREAVVWLDVACIDHVQVAENLAALPVFIMGCKSIVCLVGPTFMQRLWCAFELFIFLEAGGSLDQVITLPLPSFKRELQAQGNERSGTDIWTSFDVRSAQCCFESDREILLSTIEAACGGDLDGFNQHVHAVLHNTILNTSAERTNRKWRAYSSLLFRRNGAITPTMRGNPVARAGGTTAHGKYAESTVIQVDSTVV